MSFRVTKKGIAFIYQKNDLTVIANEFPQHGTISKFKVWDCFVPRNDKFRLVISNNSLYKFKEGIKTGW